MASPAIKKFLKELKDAFLEELWDQVLNRAITFIYHKFMARCNGEAAPLSFPDFAALILPEDEEMASKTEAAVFGPRPGRCFRLGDGNTRPGFHVLLLQHGHVVGLPRPPTSARVDHISAPDSFQFPSDAERYPFPVFARRAPRLGPVLGCGAAPLLPPPPPRSEPPHLATPPPPSSSARTPPLPSPPLPLRRAPPPAAGFLFLRRSWPWLAFGVAAAAVLALIVFARRRYQRRRRSEEEHARRNAMVADGGDGHPGPAVEE